jgi:branched-chain amino acid transport system ATP-binding protein
VTRLHLEDLHIFLGDAHVVQGVSLSIEEGQTTVILGRNGVGKTTLLRAVMGLNGAPRRGTIRWNGVTMNQLPTWRRARAGIGYVPQSRRIFSSLTVQENLQVARRKQTSENPWPLSRLYELFSNLYERRHQRASTLSGGEQQMLAVARALIGNPRVVLLDEPTEGLSPAMVARLEAVLREIKRARHAILLVEQDAKFAAKLADDIHVMQAGRMVFHLDQITDDAVAKIAERYLGVAIAEL